VLIRAVLILVTTRRESSAGLLFSADIYSSIGNRLPHSSTAARELQGLSDKMVRLTRRLSDLGWLFQPKSLGVSLALPTQPFAQHGP